MSQKGIVANGITNNFGAPELAQIFHGVIGASGILNIFGKLGCTKVNDNTVQLASGVYSLSGYLLEVAQGTTENLTIDSGTAGQSRNDMIIAEFVRNGGGAGIDTLQFRTLKGTSTTGTPADPTLTQQDINGSGVTRQEALWRVKIVGVTLTTIEAVAGTINSAATNQDNINLVDPVGSILIWPGAGTDAPTKYLWCQGQAVSRTTYAVLFTVLGTTYGSGDGSTTFNLPNLKGRIPVGHDTAYTGFDTVGETGGEINHVLSVPEMPSHTHGPTGNNYDGAHMDGTVNRTVLTSNGGYAIPYQIVANTGGGLSHNNLQPYIIMNYIIRALA